MKNKRIISLMLTALSSFSWSMAVKRPIIGPGPNKNKTVANSNSRRHRVRGIPKSDKKFKTMGGKSGDLVKNLKDGKSSVKRFRTNPKGIIPGIPNPVTITSVTVVGLTGLGFGAYGLDRKFNMLEKMGLKSKPEESLEFDGITFANYVNKHHYIEMLNFLENSVELKYYEYEGRKYLFLELDLKNGSILCACAYHLRVGMSSDVKYTSFTVDSSKKGQVEKYFETISNQIVSEKDSFEVPYYDKVVALYDDTKNNSKCFNSEVRFIVGCLLGGLSYKSVGNISFGNDFVEHKSMFLKKLDNKFTKKINSDGVLKSLFKPCFSANEMDIENQINYKLSNNIEIYSDEFSDIKDENKRAELIGEAKNKNLYVKE